MKKLLGRSKLLVLIIFAIFLSSFVLAADVAYILKNPGNPNSQLISALNELNLSYDLIDDSDILSTDFNNYDMLLIGDENFGSLADNIPVNEKNALFLSKSHVDEWKWATSYITKSTSQTIKGRILIQNSITQGFASPVTLSNSPGSYYVLPKYPSRPRSIDNIISTDNFDQHPILALVEPGDLLRAGVISEARGIYFGISNTDNWNNNAKQIFKRSVVWVLYGNDRDNDGVFDDEDNCIDNYNPEQEDTDDDGYGDACDVCALDAENDADEDGFCESFDNCPLVFNPLQLDFDEDEFGDACDDDIDDDLVLNEDDECEYTRLNVSVDEYGCASYQYIKINEVELNPVDETKEYVELYNAGNEEVNLTGWKIKDSRGRVDIISSGSIFPGGYFVFEEWMSTLDFMNNDYVQLLDNENYLIDETGFLEDDENNDKTWQRVPDGAENWVFQLATKGLNNNADVIAPIIVLISPADGEVFTTDAVSFNYRATDERASSLSCYFYADFDGEFKELASETTLSGIINDFVAEDIDDGEFEWNVKCSDGVNEVFAPANKTIIINDKPYLIQDIPSQTWNEDNVHILDLISYFGDEDNPNLVYNTSEAENINIQINGSVVTLIPDENWNGNEEVTFKACDGRKCTDSNAVSLIVNNVNDAPVLEEIEAIEVVEGQLAIVNAIASDIDDDVLIYTINDSRFTGSNPFSWQTTLNDEGVYYFEVSVSDGALEDLKIVEITILPNQAPVIISYYPEFNPIIAEDGSQDFRVTWEDADSENVIVSWYVNNNFAGLGNNFNFLASGSAAEVKAIVSDGEFNVEKIWNLETSLIPVAESYDGLTTDFSGLGEEDLENVNLILEKTGKGKIQFLELVDLRDVVDFDHYADITAYSAGIDTDIFPSLKNKAARITFYNLSFPKKPTIYYNSGFVFSGGIVCPETICSNINYNSGILSFDVISFSVFMAGETRTCSQQGGFVFSDKEICTGSLLTASDTESCCSTRGIEKPPRFEEDIDVCELIASELEVEIKDPRNNEDFILGEDIEVEIRIKNPDNESIKFDVEAYLFNIDEEKAEEEAKEKIKIKAGKSETAEFTIKIDEKIEAENDYAVFVLAKGENNQEYCNQDWKHVKIEREEDRVVINKLKIEPNTVSCGGSVNLKFSVENIGDDEQNVFLVVESADLGIYEKTPEFALEEYGEKDAKKQEFMLSIPEVDTGNYNIKVSANYAGLADEKSIDLKVNCEIPEEVVIKESKKVILGKTVKEIKKVLIDKGKGQIYLLIGLGMGILILILLIAVVAKYR